MGKVKNTLRGIKGGPTKTLEQISGDFTVHTKRILKSILLIYLIALLPILIPNNGITDPLDNWHLRTSVAPSALYGVAYGNGTFVAVGYAGEIFTSSDGISWVSRTSGTSNSLYDVTYYNGTFVAVGLAGTILTSSNGTSWSVQTSGT